MSLAKWVFGIGSLGLFLGVGAGSSLAQSAPAPKVSVEEKPLGSVGAYDSVRSVAMSADERHIAFIGVRGKQQFVILDGKSSQPYEWVVPESIDCGSDGNHLAYLVQTAVDTQVFVDGTLYKGFFTIDHNHIFWSPDAKRTAFSTQYQNGGAAMVIDGVAGPKYDQVDVPFFSPDSKKIAYAAKRGKQEFVVLDGKEQKSYDAVSRLVFSPNSRFLAYEARFGGKSVLVLNGQEGKPYDSIKMGPGFTPDGGRLLAVVAQAGKLLVVVNGRESQPWDALVVGDIIVSPDSKHLMYAVKNGDRQQAIIDNVPQQTFDHLAASAMAFSPDSRHTAYVAGGARSGSEQVVVDGVPHQAWDGILAGTPLFSPDSKRLAYGGKSGGKWRLVVDDVKGTAYDFIDPPVLQLFSPDSRRVAYRAANDKKPVVVIDGKESPAAEMVGRVSFSPDSRHAAYLRTRGEQTWAVIDETETAGPYSQGSPDMQILFDDATHAHFIATRKEDFVLVKLTIEGS